VTLTRHLTHVKCFIEGSPPFNVVELNGALFPQSALRLFRQQLLQPSSTHLRAKLLTLIAASTIDSNLPFPS
jgi:hypothetical protein